MNDIIRSIDHLIDGETLSVKEWMIVGTPFIILIIVLIVAILILLKPKGKDNSKLKEVNVTKEKNKKDFEIEIIDYGIKLDPITIEPIGQSQRLIDLVEYSGVKGGKFEGEHIKKNCVEPCKLEPGMYKGVYRKMEDGKIGNIEFEFEIVKAPEVVTPKTLEVYEDDAPFKLDGALPEGGIYVVEGEISTIFDPSWGIGSYEINYEYKDEFGSEVTGQYVIKVNSNKKAEEIKTDNKNKISERFNNPELEETLMNALKENLGETSMKYEEDEL